MVNYNGLDATTTLTNEKLINISNLPTTNCSNKIRLGVNVNTVKDRIGMDLKVIDCKNRIFRFKIPLNTVWNIDVNKLPSIEAGYKNCNQFQIRTDQSDGIFLDSVTVDDDRVEFALPVSLPYFIRGGVNFNYEVCFNSEIPGVFKFPVITWIRRKYKFENLTNYAVSDTGLAFFSPKKNPVIDSVITVPNVVKPKIITKIEDEKITNDPTNFRTILIPNAIIPEAGKLSLGNYDFLGFTTGYSITSNVMIIAAGLVPMPDDWQGPKGDMFGSYSIGTKIGFKIGSKFNVAGGYQWARSIFDKSITKDTTDSKISLNIGYLALSYGTENSRFSVNIGDSYNYHETYITYLDSSNKLVPKIESYTRETPFLSLGGDYKIGSNWKICGELSYMKNLDLIPVLFSIRYFTDKYGFDLGLGFLGLTLNGATAPKIPIAPLLSIVYLF